MTSAHPPQDQDVFLPKLQSRHVLIFGGTSGIGFAVARACLEFGATVHISGRSASRLDATLSRLQSLYPSVDAARIRATPPCDLSVAEDLEARLAAVLASATDAGATKLHHVVFTAGDFPPFSPLAETCVAEVVAMQAVRVHAAVLIAKLVAPVPAPAEASPTSPSAPSNPYLHISPDSSITLTSGTTTVRPLPGWVVPTVAGGAIEALARSAAVELAPVRVNCVVLGAVETELWERLRIPMGEEGSAHPMREGLVNGTMVGRVGRPEDSAEAYLYCMRDGFVTGTEVRSDGGRVVKL